MQRNILKADIVEVEADALIYSTNVQLMLSGGVGACLLKKLGPSFQNELYRKIDMELRKLADVGEVFYSEMSECPWKLVVHTIATDPFYYTDPEVVRSILKKAFSELSGRQNINSVVMSPIGAGYGDLNIEVFLDLVSQESAKYEESSIKQLIVCCDSESTYSELLDASAKSTTKWEAINAEKVN